MFLPIITTYNMIFKMSDDMKPWFCQHDWDYRDVILKHDSHRGLDGTIFRNYLRKCEKCGKCQRSNMMPNASSRWKNSSDIDFSKYPVNLPIEKEVRMAGEPSKKQKRQNKLDSLLSEKEERGNKLDNLLRESDS